MARASAPPRSSSVFFTTSCTASTATLGSDLKASPTNSAACLAFSASNLSFAACLALLTSERVKPALASLVCSTHCSPYCSFNLAIVSEFLALAAIPSFISAI